MSGAADGDASAASAGPAGLLPQEIRDRERVLAQPREAGRALHGQDAQHQGPPAVQVSRADRRGARLREILILIHHSSFHRSLCMCVLGKAITL